MSYPFGTGGRSLPEFSRGNRKTQVGSTKHFTGCAVLGNGPGYRVNTESHLEAQAALLLAARATTLDLVEQVEFEWYDENGECHLHFVDFVVSQTNRLIVGFAVRPTNRASPDYIKKLARIKEQAIHQGVLNDLRLFTEKDVCPVEWHNAKLFHGVRRADCFADPVAREVAGCLVGVTTIGDLVDQTGLEGMGFRAIVRLIRSGHLQMVRHERIEHETEVFKVRII